MGNPRLLTCALFMCLAGAAPLTGQSNDVDAGRWEQTEAARRHPDVEVTPDFLRGMITAAQWTFEEAERLQKDGRAAEARPLFERSYRLLLEADEVNRDKVPVNFNRIYSRLFERLRDIDTDAASHMGAIGEQTRATYGTVPVYAGQVDYFIRYFTTVKKGFTQRGLDRALKYIPMIHGVFADEGIPPDLAYMALIESGFRDAPTSGAGARGLWQFMPATARRFGLKVDESVDERLDPKKATHAAAAYLKVLHKKFGDWPLAVAAYNVGEGRIERLLRETESKTYWDLTEKGVLPEETERYVPSIVAVTLVSRDPGKYGLRSDV